RPDDGRRPAHAQVHLSDGALDPTWAAGHRPGDDVHPPRGAARSRRARVLGDRLVARQAISPDELVQAALAWEGHGRRAAIAAARLVRERSESVPETHSRLLMVFAGVPEPVCNHPYLVDGVERFRLDLAWPEFKVALE